MDSTMQAWNSAQDRSLNCGVPNGPLVIAGSPSKMGVNVMLVCPSKVLTADIDD
jgi:hypothetical protein